eukprot:comp8045_c0_seq1/m.8470 comp8045_c0_seq1/g.8470  ORF comp8045_c0_seq1/g.8470 comp8045_c0_seq1/m.8470 type:complete len:133 (-) comp8045_c0_seq1:43-441(-)
MNKDKLAKLQESVRTGGKGTMRRKVKKTVHTGAADEKTLQATFKRLNAQQVPDIESVTLGREDGTALFFKSPKFQASFNYNMYVVNGKSETKSAPDMTALQNALKNMKAGGDGDEDVPELVSNFDTAAKINA